MIPTLLSSSQGKVHQQPIIQSEKSWVVRRPSKGTGDWRQQRTASRFAIVILRDVLLAISEVGVPDSSILHPFRIRISHSALIWIMEVNKQQYTCGSD